MKMLFFLTVLFYNLYTTVVYSQDILWERSYGGKHAEYLYDAIPTPDYGFILAGSSISGKNGNKEDVNNGDLDYWVWKMDENGNLDWQKSFGGKGVDLLQSIALTNDGGFILGGTSSSEKCENKSDDLFGLEDFWIIKLDARGNELWQKTIGGSGMEKLLSIAQTKDGGYILGGTSSSEKTKKADENKPFYGKTENGRGSLDFWTVKLNSKGEIEWQKTLGGKFIDELRTIKQTKDGGYILGGYSNSTKSGDKTEPNFGEGDYWVIKLNEAGNIVWQKTYGGAKDDNLFAVVESKEGGYILGGSSNSDATHNKNITNKNGTDFWILKINENGWIEWQQTFDFGKQDMLTSVFENIDGTLLIGGYAQNVVVNSKAKNNLKKTLSKDGLSDYIAIKTKKNGEEIWTQFVGSNGDEIMRKLLETRDGGYLLTGTSNGNPSKDKKTTKGGNDFWIVKLKDNEKEQHEKISLEAIPNPTQYFTNVIVNFDYDNGTATLYDINGRMLFTSKINGEHTLPIDLSGLPTGIYIVNIKTNTQEGGVKIIKK